MSRQHISLKCRVLYEGRAQIFDRRATRDTDLEQPPNPIWKLVNRALRSNFGHAATPNGAGKPSRAKAKSA